MKNNELRNLICLIADRPLVLLAENGCHKSSVYL